MKRDIIYKIIKSLEQVTRNRPQLNLDSDAAKQMVANAIWDDVFDSVVTITTHNEDQLNFFTEFDGNEHK